MEELRDSYANVEGVRIRYWDSGGEGEVVVLIHGIGRYVEDWIPCFDKLAREYRVVALDLPGYGKSDKPEDMGYTLDELAEAVRAFLRCLEISKCSVVGHSLGGAVATRLAMTDPGCVEKLVCVSSAGFGRELNALFRILRIPRLGKMLTEPSKMDNSRMVGLLVFDENSMTKDMLAFDRQMTMLDGAQSAFLKTLKANIDLRGQSPRVYKANLEGLKTIGKKARFIWGKQDRIIPIKHIRNILEKLPDAWIEVIDNCGHMPMHEHPDAMNEILTRMLKDP